MRDPLVNDNDNTILFFENRFFVPKSRYYVNYLIKMKMDFLNYDEVSTLQKATREVCDDD